MLRVLHGVFALVVLSLPLGFASPAFAQSHFADCASMTGSNASIILSTAINPTVDGTGIEAGDEIAVFTPEGICAGAGTWSGGNMSITAWGDDIITPDKDGFAAGDPISFRLWDASAEEETGDITISYSSDQPFYRTDGNYGDNGIYVISAFAAAGSPAAPVAPAVPALATPADHAADVALAPALSWSASEGAASYDVQVSTSEDFSSFVANETGLTATTTSLADLAEGTAYFWRVRAVNAGGASTYSAAWSFTTTDPTAAPSPIPNAPVPASPADAAADVALAPTLVWHASAGAATYEVQVSTGAAFESYTVDATGVTDTTYALADLLEGTNYFWRVRALNADGASSYSTARSFTTTDPTPTPTPVPNAPVSASPADAAADVALSPTLVWHASAGAATYDVQVSTGAAFESYIVDATGVTDTTYALSDLLEGTNYFWRVRAVNASGSSLPSETSSFRTIDLTPDVPVAPIPSSPANAAVDVSPSLTLTWEAVIDAATYDLQVSTDPEFSSLVIDKTALIKTNHALEDLQLATIYYWRVRAANGTGQSPYSDAWSFTTGTTNSAPEVTNPIDDQVLVVGNAPFEVNLTESPLVFTDPDSDAMSFEAQSSDATVAAAVLEEGVLRVTVLSEGAAQVTVTAADAGGLTASLTFDVTATVIPNTTPEITSAPIKNTVTGQPYSYVVRATDADGDVLTLKAVKIPGWMSFTDRGDGTGELSGLPSTSHVGVHDIVVKVTDERGASAQQSYHLSVSTKNNAPAVVETETEILQPLVEGDATVDLRNVFKDADGDPLKFEATSDAPHVVSVDVDGYLLVITPRMRGTAAVDVKATDSRGQFVSTSFSVTVEYNRVPVAARDFAEGAEDAELAISVLTNDVDADGDALTIHVETAPKHGAAEVRNGLILYTPAENFNGLDSLTYRIVDSFGGEASSVAVIRITPVDDAPFFPAADAIVSPEDGAHLVIGGEVPGTAADAVANVAISWEGAVDPEGDSLAYVWELSASEDFAEPLLRIEVGQDTQFDMTYGAVAEALADHGVEIGSSVTGFHRIAAVAGGKTGASSPRAITLTRGTPTSIVDGDLPKSFSLEQNYPNPFNPQTTISYTLEAPAFVTLKVYNVLGREVATLVSEDVPAGRHDVRFDATTLNSGTYFYRINAGSFTATKQMILLR